MKSEKTKFFNNLKTYHIFLVSCLLGVIFIINSNYVNEKRAEDKLYKEKNILFNDIIQKRLLSEDIKPGLKEKSQNSEAVCGRSSEELKVYYKTGDLAKLDLSLDKDAEYDSEDTDHMQALIYFIRKYVDKDSKATDTTKSEDENNELKDNIMKLTISLWPILIFIPIGILSIIGWFICCCCNCCNCCCCCCCKKPGCRVPCFIFTYLFYIITISACVYGMSKSNKMFTGLANTECSFLQLFEEVLDGEAKQTTPKWIGITGINELLSNLKDQIKDLKIDTIKDLDEKIGYINNNKTEFSNSIKTFDAECYNNGNYLESYTKKFDGIEIPKYKEKTYVLDLIKLVGHKENDNKEYQEESFLYSLNTEYSEAAQIADREVETSKNSFNDVLDENSQNVIDNLDKAQKNLDKLRKPFEKVHNKIGENVAKYSKDIDDYGKLVIKILFPSLILINAALAILLLFICLCSMKYCTDCCCCRCLFKTLTHLLWNILALMVIIILLVGSVIALVGKLGDYGMSLISFIISKDNFDNKVNPLLINEFGDAKKYLNICLHGDGNLESEFDLGDSLDSINSIDEVLNNLDNITETFNQLRSELPAFKTFQELIDNRTEYRTDLFWVSDTSNHEVKIIKDTLEDNINIIFKGALTELNKEIKKFGKSESWDVDGNKDKTCDANPGTNVFHPSICKPIDRNWIKELNEPGTSQNIKDYATIISEMVDLVKKLKSSEEGSFNYKLSSLNQIYKNYLNSYIDMLQFLKEKIVALIGHIREKVEGGNLFSFLNGKFIGTDIKILLKYLRYSLGEDIYQIGICFIIIGCSLIFSVSFTILLIVIINVALEHNKDKEKQKQQMIELAAKGGLSNSEQKILKK